MTTATMSEQHEELATPDAKCVGGPPQRKTAQVMVAVCAYNEGPKLEAVLDRLARVEGIDVLVVDDGSTDGTAERARRRGAAVLRHEGQRGAGASERSAMHYCIAHVYDIMVSIAGNNKDNPDEIERLIAPIRNDELDFVQGSRYLPGGYAGNTPRYRRIATRYVHPWVFSWASGKRMTDTTNGFRAIHRSVFERLRPELDQPWLDRYEYEPYLLCKAIQHGFRVGEVPVTKIYPPRKLGYTKMKPITGWWSILKPLFLMKLGLRE